MSSFDNTYSSADSNTTSSDPSRDIFHDDSTSSSTPTHTHAHSHTDAHAHTDAHSHSHSNVAPPTSDTTSSSRGFEGNLGDEAGGITKSGVQGGDRFDEQPGSTHVSDHKRTVDPSNVDVSIGSKGDGLPQPREESAPGAGGTSYSGGEGTGINNTIPGGVKGTGGMGKRDGEDAMGGGGGVVGKIAEKLHMGHGNK